MANLTCISIQPVTLATMTFFTDLSQDGCAKCLNEGQAVLNDWPFAFRHLLDLNEWAQQLTHHVTNYSEVMLWCYPSLG
jgi:hypothetical protein